MITKDDTIHTRVLRKETHKDQYLNIDSNHLIEHKRAHTYINTSVIHIIYYVLLLTTLCKDVHLFSIQLNYHKYLNNKYNMRCCLPPCAKMSIWLSSDSTTTNLFVLSSSHTLYGQLRHVIPSGFSCNISPSRFLMSITYSLASFSTE